MFGGDDEKEALGEPAVLKNRRFVYSFEGAAILEANLQVRRGRFKSHAPIWADIPGIRPELEREK
jgi:hypothetical protein